MLIREHVPLAPLTTLGVGGPARYFAEARTEEEVTEAVEFARSRDLPLFVLGGGSNVVIADAGFAGLALKIAISDFAVSTAPHGMVTFVTGAGYEWDALVKKTVEADCAGLECLSGIPGTVGGTPVQNVGAYGQEVSETIQEVRVLDLQSMELKTLSKADCGFAYRSTIFNTSERGRYIILRVSFALRQGGHQHCVTPIYNNSSSAALQNRHCPRYGMPCAKFAAGRQCSSFPAMTTPTAWDRSSRIRSLRSRASNSCRQISPRAEWSCQTTQPATVCASFPQRASSNTPDLLRATLRATQVSHADTPWQSSTAAVPPLPRSLR